MAVKDIVALKPLTRTQAETLCAKVESGLLGARAALAELEERLGYKALGYKTMRNLLQVRFRVGERGAQLLLEGARTAQKLLPHLDPKIDITRMGDVALHELKKVGDPEKQAEVVRKVFETTEGPITSTAVKKVINEADNGEAKAEPPPPILDEIGEQVPPGLSDVFNARANFRKVLAQIKTLKTSIAALTKGPAGRELRRKLTGVELDRESLHTKIASSMPFGLCVNCKGQRLKCTVCGGEGWMSQTQHENAWKG